MIVSDLDVHFDLLSCGLIWCPAVCLAWRSVRNYQKINFCKAPLSDLDFHLDLLSSGLIWFDVMSSCVFGADTGFALISPQMEGEGDHSERDRWKWRCSPLCQTGTVSITIHQDTRYNSNGPLFLLQPEKLDFWELASELVQMCGNPVTGCRLTAEWRNMGAVEEALIAI